MEHSGDQTINPQKYNGLTSQFEGHIKSEEVGSIIGLIYKDGQVEYQNKFGYQNIEQQTPVEYDSIFRIYSMTKPIVAVAALQLWEQGKYQLSDPVSKFIPKFKDLKVIKQKTEKGIEVEDMNREITMLDIFTHTAGLSYGFDPKDPIDVQYIPVWKELISNTLGELIDGFTDIPLKYQPGTKWHYSIATDVLGYLVEVISGLKLDDYLKINIFDKLQMGDTGFYVPEEKLSRFVTIYTTSKDKLVEFHTPETERHKSPVTFFSGGGGLVSTLSDYLIFCKMLLNEGKLKGQRILSSETVKMMISNHLSDDLPPIVLLGTIDENRYGLGIGVKTVGDNFNFSLGSYYWGGMALTNFIIDPKEKIIMILLSQYLPRMDRNYIRDKFYKLAITIIKNSND